MNQTARPLIPEQRHQEILRLLRREGVLSIHSLTDYMNVSHMTVRRDVTALEGSGQVVSVQGGVRLAERTDPSSPPRSWSPGPNPNCPSSRPLPN